MYLKTFLNELNKTQQKAVEAPQEPVLLLAGPGTGKTRTLIARIAYQIYKYEIPPQHILALTFSNKAASEISNRLADVLKEKATKIKACTIHSFCLDILRKYHERAGLHKHFTVCDDDYRQKLIRDLLKDRVRENPERAARGVSNSFDGHSLKGRQLPPFSAMIYEEYQKHLTAHRLIDFNMIITKTLSLLQGEEDIVEQYRYMYQAVHVDEFQDTDRVQYEIIRLLTKKRQNIFVVADDDQSIYAWRGANPQNIRQFMTDFHIDRPIFLEVNYRSGSKIVSIASNVVQDTERVEPNKIIQANNMAVIDEIQSYFFNNEGEETDFILKKISEWHDTHHVPLKEIAVLYPRHIFGEPLTNQFIKQRIPFQRAGGKALADNPAMKKLLLYLRLIRDPLDDLILEELVELELGYSVAKQIQTLMHDQKSTFRLALFEFASLHKDGAGGQKTLTTFTGRIANLINLKSFFTFRQIVDLIVSDMGPDEQKLEWPKLEALDFSALKLPGKYARLWFYHKNSGISYLAAQMAQKAFNNEVHIFDASQNSSLKKADILINLSMDAPAFPGKIYDFTNKYSGKNRSPISAFFRWIQYILVQDAPAFTDYVVFDLETTGRDTETCGIVEIAAVRVRQGKVTETFQTLVNPQMPVEAAAQAVHHISDEELQNAPVLAEVWPRFKEFIADDMLIAHNGHEFDFRIINRYGRIFDKKKPSNIRYDSLILARHLYPNSRNSIDALADKFRLDPGNRHRALDDVIVLNEIFLILLQEDTRRERDRAGEDLLEYLALAIFLQRSTTIAEDKKLFNIGIAKLLSPYAIALGSYCQKFNKSLSAMRSGLQAFAGMTIIETTLFNSGDDFKNRILEMAKSFDHLEANEAIAEFLSVITLLNPQDRLKPVEAVSLLTIHAAKGLEFRKVIIIGLEDDNMPSWFTYKTDDDDERSVAQKMDEQKRVLYVAITRAKEEVLLTAVKHRSGRSHKSSPFLREILKFMRENT